MTPYTEVGKAAGHDTSVQNTENRPWIRKSGREQGMKLPSKTQKRELGYGSQQGYRARNFRPKCRKWGSGTEASKGTRQETSVQNAENGALIRKPGREQGIKLPSKTQKTGLGYGSQQGYRARYFRPKCRKGSFDTEVIKHMRHETSVQNTEKGAWIRKSARVQGIKLPSKSRKQASGTEAGKL